jgi:phospholipase D1/2
VTQALTRKYLSPTLPQYLHSLLPRSTDAVTSVLVELGLLASAASMEYLEAENPLIAPPVTVSSSHTKHALEDLHPNIAVFRHPDHLPDAQTMQSSLISSLQNLKLDAATVSRLGGDALKSVYGMTGDVILYWAHHEKLCLVDGKVAFMGGLDLCYGRWDTNQHAIADAHPQDLNAIVFPGQDYNNARIMDFDDVVHYENNKLDRKTSSRMGWSDISISLHGPVVQDLRRHFVDRWNFILDEKYTVRKDARYSRLSPSGPIAQNLAQNQSRPQAAQSGNVSQQESTQPHLYAGYGSQPQFPPPPGSTTGYMPNQQNTSRPHSPRPLYQSQQTQPHYQGSYSGQQEGQFYPPPPPGPPPSSQYGSGPQGSDNPYNQPPPPGNSYSSELEGTIPQTTNYNSQQHAQHYAPPPNQQTRGFDDEEPADQSYGDRGFGGKPCKYTDEGRRLKDEVKGIGNMLYGHAEQRFQSVQGKYTGGKDSYGRPTEKLMGSMPCQIVRSCTKWSNGTPTEHSIQNAYIDIIQRSQHFIYIENQFFITATGDSQKPVKNQIGKAIVERVVRAARAGERYKVIVLMPSVPAFAGDLRDDAALGTRAIMEFQYNSINRGGHSIMEMIAKEGINPTEYIRFYNLRNYDRINASAVMQQAEQRSGVNYEDARRQHDDAMGAGYGGYGEGTAGSVSNPASQYQQYQQAAQQVSGGKSTGSGRWDTVSECYMLGGEDIRNVPWDYPSEVSEIDAFVSEELYIHSKVRV